MYETAISKKDEYGTEFLIYIRVQDTGIRVFDVGVKRNRHKKFRRAVEGLKSTPEYINGTLDTVVIMEDRAIRDACPAQFLNEALLEVWDSMRPALYPHFEFVH